MIPSEPLPPAAAPPEPWRSARRRTKSRAAMEAEEDAKAEAERGKRRRGAAGMTGTARRRRAAKDKLEEVGAVAAADAPGVMEVDSAARRTAFGGDDVCADEPDAEDTSPAPAAEPRRRRKSAALVEAEADAEHERRRRAAGKAGTAFGGDDVCADEPGAEDMPPAAAAGPRRSTRRRRKSAALVEAEADAEHERGRRRRGAAGNACTARRRVDKDDEPKQVEAPGVMEAGDAARHRTAIDSEDACAEDELAEEEEAAALEAEEQAMVGAGSAETVLGARRRVARPSATTERMASDGASSEDHFVGEPVPEDEARRRWPARYKAKDPDSNARWSDWEIAQTRARCHYLTACVDGVHFDLGDDVYIKAAPDEENYTGRITEFFKGTDHRLYYSCRWFFRVADTAISPKLLKVEDHKHDIKRVFLSEDRNDNMIDSIISKVNVIYVSPNMTHQAKVQLISKADFYYDMSYSLAYSTFANIPSESGGAAGSEETSDISCDDVDSSKEKITADLAASSDAQMKTATLLDLYSGCGAMSTGLCLGAAMSGTKLNTKWAVDMNSYACNSLKHNHPGTKVRNEKAGDFICLLLQWDALCKKYDVHNSNSLGSDLLRTSYDDEDDEHEPLPKDTFEVEKLVDICHGDPNSTGEVGLWFKVRWKMYDPSVDTWEPIEGLSDSTKCIKEFVESGYRESILPLPGCVDVICGGPPCQGISRFNRFREHEDPLKDEKNQQLVVFMDIVNHLRPKFVLMENVVDILKFADGFLGSLRAFLWGALPSIVLPKFPLPTHNVIMRGIVPTAFSHCLVAYAENEYKHLQKALFLRDAISDLPEVENHQPNDVMEYHTRPQTEFQHYIRLNRKEMQDYSLGGAATPKESQLYDHQPLQLNHDDYERVQQIPVKKGANFRDLKGVQVGVNNTVEFIPNTPRTLLSSGKPLVPNYAMSYIKGKSRKPFGRFWWDETVPTVVTRAEPHNQIILHPTQHRVLTVRENARLQGFPDYYRLFGPIKEKYIQVGNAVPIPVARALGYSLGQAYQSEFHGDHPLFKLPGNFIPVNHATVTRASSVGTSGGEVVETE